MRQAGDLGVQGGQAAGDQFAGTAADVGPRGGQGGGLQKGQRVSAVAQVLDGQAQGEQVADDPDAGDVVGAVPALALVVRRGGGSRPRCS